MCNKAFLRIWMSSLCFMLFNIVTVGQIQEMPARIRVMKVEINRNFQALQKEQVPPYYLGYSIDEVRTQLVAGTFGAIINKSENETAYLRIDLRTGSYTLDNSHELRGDSLSALRRRISASTRAPTGESPKALAVMLWRAGPISWLSF